MTLPLIFDFQTTPGANYIRQAGFGTIRFVDSNGTGSTTSGGLTQAAAFTTLQAAITASAAGDTIIVKPGHAETITGAGGLAAAVSDLRIIGLGYGSRRPTFLMDGGTTVDFTISGAGTYLENLVFNSGHADVVRCFAVTAKGVTFNGIEFGDNTTDENWLTPIKATSTTDNNADGLTVINCRWLSPDAGCLEFIEANADVKGLIVLENYVAHEGTSSPLVLFATGKDAQYCNIQWNFLSHKMTANELLVNIDTSANSGIIAHNRVGHADVTTTHDLGIDGLGCRLFDNLSTSVDNLSGLVLPAADVDS